MRAGGWRRKREDGGEEEDWGRYKVVRVGGEEVKLRRGWRVEREVG